MECTPKVRQIKWGQILKGEDPCPSGRHQPFVLTMVSQSSCAGVWPDSQSARGRPDPSRSIL